MTKTLKELKGEFVDELEMTDSLPEVWFEACLKCGSIILMHHRADVDEVIETGHLDDCPTQNRACERCGEFIKDMGELEEGHSSDCPIFLKDL